jgi:hypothetical protein
MTAKEKQETLEEALERIRQESFTCCSLSKSINYVTVGEREKTAFYNGAKWYQEQNKKTHTALETAISLLKQTTEYEVLDSWKQKVKELEQLINKI